MNTTASDPTGVPHDAARISESEPAPKKRRGLLGHLFFFLLGLVVLLLIVWGSMALRFSNLPVPALRNGTAIAFGLWGLWALFVPGPRRRNRQIFWASLAVVAIWWVLIPASNDRDWMPDVGVVPSVAFDGDQLTVRNIRNCAYVTKDDYTPEYYDKSYDLSKLVRVDMGVSYFSKEVTDIAHTFLSYVFEDDETLAISIEVRKEVGEGFSPVRGLFKQFELIYILGDERDIIGSRVNYRHEDVYLYPLSLPVDEVRSLLLDMLEEVDSLVDRPEFYHSIYRNCTTSIVLHLDHILPTPVIFDWRLLLNGDCDRLAYERNALAVTGEFEDIRRLHHINDAVAGVDRAADARTFSRQIRAGWDLDG